ncbi:MAG: CoA-binding protein, partial [Desulfobacterales bacterium]|nr:CoA-binding protein [Desulfobacterales bacterium]
SIKESPLFKIANPESIAMFGASNNITSMGSIMLNSLLSIGYEGTIYPVHLKEETVQNLKAYKNVLDLPEIPDLAIIVLPTHIVCETMDQCGRKGIKHAVVVSGGFKEVGTQGKHTENELIQIAGKYGIRFLGPNCLGIANPHRKLNPTPFIYEGLPGFIGMASQSGSFVTQMFDYLNRLGLGFSSAFSVGNEANIDIIDCMKYLGACPNTKVISMYIEGIKQGKAFIETARSIIPHKPIVALYVGGSETGKQAGFSHTGAMAGPDRLYDGIFRQSGVIRAQSITELFDFCWALSSLPSDVGRKVIIQTNSGGPGATAADAIGREGMKLPPLSKKTNDKLSSFIPHTGSVKNPVDITFSRNQMDFYTSIPEILLEEENADILMVYFLAPTNMIKQMLLKMGVSKNELNNNLDEIIKKNSDAFVSMLDKHKKPVVGYTYNSIQDHFIRALVDRGIPIFPDPKRAAKAIGAVLQYGQLSNKIKSTQTGAF